MPSSPDLPDLPLKLAAEWPLATWEDVNLVVAVSGGKDSVCLLHLLQQVKKSGRGTIYAAHLNHHLRREASDKDEQFVRDLCEQLDVPLEVGKFEVSNLVDEQGDGIEAAARHARYEFLRQIASKCGARYVATAHTADDQIETILHRIVRGTAIAGLSGITFSRQLDDDVTLVRPLLHVRTHEIERYVQANGLEFRSDESNTNLHFTRNRIRHDLLPKLRTEYNPMVDDALLRLGHLAGECQSVLDSLASDLVNVAASVAADEALIDCGRLVGQQEYVVCEVFKQIWSNTGWPQQGMGKGDWESLADIALATTEAATRDFPGRIRAKKKGEQLSLTRLG